MARQPMVTRTIMTTIVSCFCANTQTRETFEQNFTLPRTYKDDVKITKTLDKLLEHEPVKVISILGTEVKETLYGMTEQDFIASAKVLPPRNVEKL